MRLHRSPHSFDPLNRMEQDGDAAERWPPSSSSRRNAEREDACHQLCHAKQQEFCGIWLCADLWTESIGQFETEECVRCAHAAAFCSRGRCFMRSFLLRNAVRTLTHTQLEGALDSLVGRHDDHAFSVFNDCKYSMEMECEARPGEARRGEAWRIIIITIKIKVKLYIF